MEFGFHLVTDHNVFLGVPFDMIHLVFGTSSPFHSVNLVPVFLALTLLFLRLSRRLSVLILHSLHPQLPRSFTPRL